MAAPAMRSIRVQYLSTLRLTLYGKPTHRNSRRSHCQASSSPYSGLCLTTLACQIRENLPRDEALGILEKVRQGEPTRWCHRMVIIRKHDGTPRRTVDLFPQNKFCQRETILSEALFQLSRRIPIETQGKQL